MASYKTRVSRADGSSCAHAFSAECERCREESARQIKMPAVVSFKPTIYEHIFEPWEKPYAIESRTELREECIKRGVISEDLRQSIVHRSGPDRWV